LTAALSSSWASRTAAATSGRAITRESASTMDPRHLNTLVRTCRTAQHSSSRP
jgi:hypothetical protein